MLYRRKILLALLHALGGQVHKRDFQKQLFLFTRSQAEPTFDFIPYKFGCYSLSAEADRHALIKQGLLFSNDKWENTTNVDYVSGLKDYDKQVLYHHIKAYGKLKGKELVKFVYQEYPYFAINSSVASEIMSRTELKRIEESRATDKKPMLFTIGYESKTFEHYLNQLVLNNVTVLCDVRKNPLSRKFGFSKKTLQHTVEQLGIIYKHIPSLGIASSMRQALNSQNDYDLLFDNYEKSILPLCDDEIDMILSLLANGDRVALTCFELRPRQCHRGRVASRLLEDKKWDYTLLHI